MDINFTVFKSTQILAGKS